MRRNLFLILFVAVCFPLLIGASTRVYQEGYTFTTLTKTDTNADDAYTATTETDTVVWTPASGKKIYLMGMKFNSDTATTLLVESGSTAVVPFTECTASGQVVIQSSVPIWVGDADATLTYTTGTKGRHSIMMWGFESMN